MALTDKQRRFVDEYLIDLNATQAAVRAGYSENTARSIGSENLGKPAVAAAIAEAQQMRAARTEITADRVVRELARVAFSDLRGIFTENGHLIDPRDWDSDIAAAIAAVEVVTSSRGEKDTAGRPAVKYTHKIKVWDKISALEKLGRHLGMFVNRHEHTGKDGGPLVPILNVNVAPPQPDPSSEAG